MADLVDKVNARSSSVVITDEPHTIGEDEANVVYLDEAPEEGTTVTVTGTPTYTQIASGTPADDEYRVEYDLGKIVFNSLDDGDDILVDYSAVGSVLVARDVNRANKRLRGEEALDQGSPYVEEVTVTAAASVNLDLRTQAVVYMLLDADTTLETETSVDAGRAGQIAVEQDTPAHTLSFGANWVVEGTVPSGDGDKFLVSWRVRGSEIWAVISGALA